ncbi:cobalamin biosynthesis protein CobD [Ornithinimicrobium avium]|uniref:Cobalamin biosynthesis protein CobD n=1 Tax=Ornithinimicrobium avium TaxID=2283195 RepID=A0A345NSR7_9MICO|nr:cobalamin biosynthesis protein CobD [Ornithinimicrobium avium]
MLGTTGQRALGVVAGLLLDRALGEPPDRWHPVAWFGTAMGRVEKVVYRDSRAAGAIHAGLGAGLGAAAGVALVAGAGAVLAPAGREVLRGALPVALAVAVASAGRMLRRTSRTIEEHLLQDDLAAARATLPSLVGRDPSGLDGSGVAAAVVESLAENTVDAVVAPAFWGLVAGAPGVLVHRAVNTMDAMVGHRSARYARFGTAAARLDDAMAWLPARLFAALVGVLAPGRAGDLVRLVRRDAPAHPSPNSGVAEAAVAAALAVELGGPLRYGDQVEDRPRLGDGPRPGAGDITRARQLVDRAELTVVALCLAAWWAGRAAPHTRRRDA